MKYGLLLSLCLIISCALNAQERLKGTYSTGPNFSGEVLKFEKGNKFEYKEWSCTYHKSGKGKYQIKDNTLLLRFSQLDDSLLNNSNYTIVEQTNTENDSSEVQLYLKDEKVKPIWFANITVLQEGEAVGGSTTDLEGWATVTVPKNGHLSISLVGYKKLIIPIPDRKKITLNVNMKESSFYFKIYNKVYSYRIKSKTKNSFVLIPKSDHKRECLFKKKWR